MRDYYAEDFKNGLRQGAIRFILAFEEPQDLLDIEEVDQHNLEETKDLSCENYHFGVRH